MSFRYHGRAYADATSPRAWAICDRCGFLYNHHDLKWQMQFNGTQLYNTRMLVCSKCLDIPQPQLLAPILQPDPLPIANPRQALYSVNEAGTYQDMQAQVFSSTPFDTTLYIDLFNGNPASGASSVLATITGSATRTNFASSMSGSSPYTNTEAIVLTSNVAASANVSWIGIYDAATDGTLLMSAQLLNPMTAVLYNILQFDTGDLQVTIT